MQANPRYTYIYIYIPQTPVCHGLSVHIFPAQQKRPGSLRRGFLLPNPLPSKEIF